MWCNIGNFDSKMSSVTSARSVGGSFVLRSKRDKPDEINLRKKRGYPYIASTVWRSMVFRSRSYGFDSEFRAKKRFPLRDRETMRSDSFSTQRCRGVLRKFLIYVLDVSEMKCSKAVCCSAKLD